jgi:hypothetical protein
VRGEFIGVAVREVDQVRAAHIDSVQLTSLADLSVEN